MVYTQIMHVTNLFGQILTHIVYVKTAGVNCLHIAIVKVDDSL